MPRYIDADWIVQKLEGWQDQLAETYGENDEYVQCLGEVLIKIENAPTADVAEVVRCKDCIHYNAGFECLKEGYGIECPPDYYCADGKRKETEDADS